MNWRRNHYAGVILGVLHAGIFVRIRGGIPRGILEIQYLVELIGVIHEEIREGILKNSNGNPKVRESLGESLRESPRGIFEKFTRGIFGRNFRRNFWMKFSKKNCWMHSFILNLIPWTRIGFPERKFLFPSETPVTQTNFVS